MLANPNLKRCQKADCLGLFDLTKQSIWPASPPAKIHVAASAVGWIGNLVIVSTKNKRKKKICMAFKRSCAAALGRFLLPRGEKARSAHGGGVWRLFSGLWNGSCVAPPCKAVPAFAWTCHATINKGLSAATINKGARGLGRERREGQEEARTWRHSERARHPARHVKRRWCAGADGHLTRGAASQQASKPSHSLAEQWEREQGKGDGGEGGTLARKGAN